MNVTIIGTGYVGLTTGLARLEIRNLANPDAVRAAGLTSTGIGR